MENLDKIGRKNHPLLSTCFLKYLHGKQFEKHQWHVKEIFKVGFLDCLKSIYLKIREDFLISNFTFCQNWFWRKLFCKVEITFSFNISENCERKTSFQMQIRPSQAPAIKQQLEGVAGASGAAAELSAEVQQDISIILSSLTSYYTTSWIKPFIPHDLVM